MAVALAPPRTRALQILALVGAAQFMLVADDTIVNVALPSIRSDLGFDAGNAQAIFKMTAATR